MKVLVIIVSYNFEPWIDRCLGSLRRSAHPADVMVIDNASTDETVRRIKAGYPEVRLVESPTNLGGCTILKSVNPIGRDIPPTSACKPPWKKDMTLVS